MNILSSLVRKIIIILIKSYKLAISPLLPDTCRFYPSCSSYALEAFEKYGIFNGLFLTLKRLLKCHPFYQGGYDPLK